MKGLRVARRTYLKPWSKLKREPLGPKDLQALGKLLVKVFSEEARKDFARRGWSLKAPGAYGGGSSTQIGGVKVPERTPHAREGQPQGGPHIDKSFSFRIVGNQIEIQSTYYGLDELLSKGIPKHPMPWLTQEMARRKDPSREGPLVVPIRGSFGTTLFRVAPERIADAWVHPGIRRLTFGDRAVRRARTEMNELLLEVAARRLAQGDPLR